MIKNREFDREFETLKTGVKNILGFNTFQYKNNFLERRLDARLRVHHLNSYLEYFRLLKRDKAEQEKLLNSLTINVTEFFRDNQVYSIFQNEVVPNIIKEKKRKIRIWSAGCSDGKEAYSIAMIIMEKLGVHHAKNRVEITGTDIDRDCLQTAISGKYISRSETTKQNIEKQMRFIETPEKYFEINDGIFTAKPCLKEIVNFQYHDLISGPKRKNFDIIFCRNVVIYFTRELQEILYINFYNALNPGAYLVTGKTETLKRESRNLFTPYNLKEGIFIKK